MNQLKIPLAEIPAIARESLAVVYDAIHAGHLDTFLVGRRRFARPEAIRAWVDYLETQSNVLADSAKASENRRESGDE